MNTHEAKEILLLYRGPADDADPQFREALAHAQRDLELAEWLREQTRCYDAIRAKLRGVEPPIDLPQKIIRARPIPFGRRAGTGRPRERGSARYDLLYRLQPEWTGARIVRARLHQKRPASRHKS